MPCGPPQILEIPELEEEGKEDLTHVVADAPRLPAAAALGRIPGLQELGGAGAGMAGPMGARHGGMAGAGGLQEADLDLSLLTACLLPSDQVGQGATGEGSGDAPHVGCQEGRGVQVRRERHGG